METIPQATYSSALSAKAALLDERLAVLREIDRGLSVSDVQAMVMDNDLLGKVTLRTSENVWENTHARYLTRGDSTKTLARMVVLLHFQDRSLQHEVRLLQEDSAPQERL